MIYISDIISKDGVHVHSALRDGCELSFSDERFWGSLREVLGYSPSQGVVVRHRPRDAEFLNYVRGISFIQRSGVTNDEDIDWVVLSDCKLSGKQISGHRVISVWDIFVSYAIYDNLVFNDWDSDDLGYTLYEFIVKLSKLSGVTLFSYDEIVILNSREHEIHIRLPHIPRADLFFSKAAVLDM